MNQFLKKIDSNTLAQSFKLNIIKIQLKRSLSNSSQPASKVKRMGSLKPITLKGINLNEKEKNFSNLLLNIVDFIHAKNPSINPPQLRFAGGWVRDKLLGKESDDIDVAIDNMTGYQFAQYFTKYMLKNNFIHKASIGKIASNPDKSKHLETATTHYEDMAIDFVHLRSETYNTNSRIPESVQFGTPWEDALRRDITINALFYNLHTGLVEDFTHKGLEDLGNKIIRTPLEPKETFLDDPLRVLRVVRFASRFNFIILKQIEETIELPEIKNALAQKISKERVCTELTKMLKGPNPLTALETLYRLDLYPSLFDLSTIDIPKDSHIQPYTNGLNASRLAYWLISNTSYKGPNNIFDSFELPLNLMEPHYDLFKENTLEILLGSYLSPFDRIEIQIPKKSKTTPLVSMVCTNSLKITNKVIDTIHTMSEGSITLDQLRYLNETILDRVRIGNFIFQTKQLWPAVILYDTIYKLTPLVTETEVLDKDTFQSILNNYATLMNYIHDENLGLSYKNPLPLSGKDIAKILNMKPGKLIGHISQGVRDWRLLNPNGTKVECEQWVVQRYSDPEEINRLNMLFAFEYETLAQSKKQN